VADLFGRPYWDRSQFYIAETRRGKSRRTPLPLCDAPLWNCDRTQPPLDASGYISCGPQYPESIEERDIVSKM